MDAVNAADRKAKIAHHCSQVVRNVLGVRDIPPKAGIGRLNEVNQKTELVRKVTKYNGSKLTCREQQSLLSLTKSRCGTIPSFQNSTLAPSTREGLEQYLHKEEDLNGIVQPNRHCHCHSPTQHGLSIFYFICAVFWKLLMTSEMKKNRLMLTELSCVN
jgi:hypothetical protein